MKKKHSLVLSIIATSTMAMLLVWGCKREEIPTLSTLSVTDITKYAAKSGGNVTDDGGEAITSRGVVWNTTQNPSINQNLGFTLDIPGTGQFVSDISNLTRYTKYYVRAYATNKVGVAYGNELEFTTESEPTLITTDTIISIAATTAVGVGTIIDDGGAAITSRGVVWSASPNPTIETNLGITSNGTGIGHFTSEMTNLTSNTMYFFKAYAISSLGVFYGEEFDFTTRDGICTIYTTPVNNIRVNSAQTGGFIPDDGGATITSRGVVWSNSPNPTTETNLGSTSNGSSYGHFTSELTNLTPNTKYYIKAFATSSFGTFYGEEFTFTTRDGTCTISTTVATNITVTTVQTGGNITDDGGATVTERGIYWGTSSSPENTGTKLQLGSETGNFSTTLTDLTSNKIYYIRAYATNSFGTHYGNQVNFTTRAPDGPGSSVTDVDGNVYNTVWINNRLWTKENLKTTKFNDGTDIPLITDNQTSSYSRYCWYNNDIANKPIYGALYNFFTVKTGKLCPTGWHVPSYSEWLGLMSYAGGGMVAGGKLKSTRTAPDEQPRWDSPNTGATDEYGLSTLPGGGYRSNSDTFYGIGTIGAWWTTEITYNYIQVLGIGMTNNSVNMDILILEQGWGYSVRCVKD